MSYTTINCPHCHTEQVGAQITSGAQLPDEDDEVRYFFVAVCRKCNFPSIIIARRTPSRLTNGPPLVKHVCRTERDPIPNFIEPVEMIPSPCISQIPENLPDNVASAYTEARDCQQRGSILSAAMGYRLTLERATRALKGDPGKPLVDRISTLVSEHTMPANLGEWSSEIDLISNEPANQDTDPTVEALRNAADFTEMFLICTFTLPIRIDQRHGPNAEAGLNGGSGSGAGDAN